MKRLISIGIIAGFVLAVLMVRAFLQRTWLNIILPTEGENSPIRSIRKH